MKDASSEIGFEAGMKDLLCFVLVVVFFGGLSSVLPSSQGFGVLLCFLEWPSIQFLPILLRALFSWEAPSGHRRDQNNLPWTHFSALMSFANHLVINHLLPSDSYCSWNWPLSLILFPNPNKSSLKPYQVVVMTSVFGVKIPEFKSCFDSFLVGGPLTSNPIHLPNLTFSSLNWG